MSFTALNAAVADLRNSLRSFVGQDAISEINVRPPARDGDEASFMRLVSWSYALIFEAGRVTVPYLLELQKSNVNATFDPKSTRKLVHALRTWSFHNLGFTSDHDLELSRCVYRWFLKTCDVTQPDNDAEWHACYHALCIDVIQMVEHCQKAITFVLSAPDDGQTAIVNLRHRIHRSWPVSEFDKIVSDAATRLGMKIDTQKFRGKKLNKWRNFLDGIPEEDNPISQMTRMIERDLLDCSTDILPIDGRDVMNALDIDPGPKVGVALHHARKLFRSGIRDRKQILEDISRTF